MSARIRSIRLGRGRTAALAAGALVASALAVPAASPAFAATAPTTPANFAAAAGTTPSTAALSWKPSVDPLGIVGYQIWRQAASGTNLGNTLIATTDGSVTHYNATHLYGATAYTFQVIALDTTPLASAPATVQYTTDPSAATGPTPPATSSVALHAFSDGRIDIVWAASTDPDVSGYKVLRDGVEVAQVDLPGGLRYSDTGLSPSTPYTYAIEAVDSAGNVSAATTAKTASTLPSGTVQVARGPYVSDVTATSAVVSWWTNIPTTGLVDYGAGSLSSSASDANTSVQHAVTLTGLTAGTSYSYTVGDSATRTTPATFNTAPTPGTSFSFAAIGDFGGASPGEAQNAANINTAGTSFIQTLGDNIYPSSGLPDPNFATTYSDFDARFFKQFGPALRNQAFFPANGNQEYYSNGAFWNAFPMPGSNHSWYSYDWGNAHISVLDSQLAYGTGSAQYNWLQSDLAAHQGATFRIVVLQAPPYSSTSANSSSKTVQQSLVPLFQQQHVALVLSGNSHNYERTVPMSGITYIVSGGGGNGHNAFTTVPAPSWSAARSDTRYEYVKVSVSPVALKVDAIDAPTNTVFDTTTIAAPPTAPGAPTIGTASALSTTSALVTWTAPADNGRSPITGYTATASPGGMSCSTTGATSCTITGLTPGATYTFSVVARNAVGPSPASAASNTVTPSIPTALVLSSAPLSAVGGSTITVTGKLTRSDTAAALANQPVQLQQRRLGSTGAFTTLPAIARTSAAGVAVFRVVLAHSTQYRLTTASGATYNGATSLTRNVSAVRKLTIAPSARAVKLHGTYRIAGSVTPASKGARIYLQRKVGTVWSTRASTLVTAASTYSFPMTAPARGALVYRTVILGGPFLATSYSPATGVTVR